MYANNFIALAIILSICHVNSADHGTNDSNILHIIHMYSSEVAGLPYLAGLESIDFAVELLNNRTDILEGYTIQLHIMDVEQWQVGNAMKSFIDAVTNDPIKIGMIGPIFSQQTEVLAQTAGFYHLVEIGYRQTSPSLSDLNIFPYFLRTIENGGLWNFAIARIIQHFEWKYVASVAYDSDFVIWTREHLINLLLDKNITIAETASYSHRTISHTNTLRSSGAHILVSHIYHRPLVDQRRMFCELYKEGLYGRKYQWIHWTRDFGIQSELSIQDTIDDGCSLRDMYKVIEGMLTFKVKRMSQIDYETRIGSHGMTTEALIAEYRRFLEVAGDKYSGDANDVPINSNAFDAIWSLALGLNKSIADFEAIGENLKSYNYDKKAMADILFENVRSLNYFGAIGPMSYDQNGDYQVVVEIDQIRNGESVLVGYYSPFTDDIEWLVEQESLFPGLDGRPPYDRDIILMSDKKKSRALFYTTVTLSTLGIIYAVITFAYTWYYRQTRFIKMSSPRINGLICFGCIIGYLAVILWGVGLSDNAKSHAICKLRLWFLVTGFTCSFGSMFSKTWRVHTIISTKTLERKSVKDSQLLLLVGGCFAVDALVLFIWELVDPLHPEQLLLDIENDDDQDGIIYQPAIYKCDCEYGGYWSGVLYGIKGLLLIFGIFFAWETRNVQIEGLNDSKQIGVCVYSVMVASMVAVPLVNILSEEQYDIIYGITVISVLICSTLIITLVFATKAHALFRYGTKVDQFVKTHFQASQQQNQPCGNQSNAGVIESKPSTRVSIDNTTQSTLASTVQHNLRPPIATVSSGKANRVAPGLDN